MMDYRARWYDPRLGRFLTRDPVGFGAGDPNLYRYVHNDPFDATDPSGLEEVRRFVSADGTRTWLSTNATLNCGDPLLALAVRRSLLGLGSAAEMIVGGIPGRLAGAGDGHRRTFRLAAKLAAGKPVSGWDVLPVALAVPRAVGQVQSMRAALADIRAGNTGRAGRGGVGTGRGSPSRTRALRSLRGERRASRRASPAP